MSNEEQPDSSHETRSPEGPRVLVVDDEYTITHVLAQVLGEKGCEVQTAGSAERGLELLRQAPVDLVVTDIILPGMSGLELLSEIGDVCPEAEVIVMTSHASLDTVTTALRNGAWDFLTKPFDDISWIAKVVDRAGERVRLLLENRRLTKELVRHARALEESNEALRELAERDGLTGLFNHRYFQDDLARELERAKSGKKPLSVLFLDVDHFKVFNDTNGHLMGDELLKELAKLLCERFDGMGRVSRYGGEEIVVLLPDLDKTRALELAEELRHAVETRPFPGVETLPQERLTVSIGVAAFPEDGFDSRSLVGHADQAVYQAKSHGRNEVCA